MTGANASKRITTLPSLIIGVGGTGDHVLREIKDAFLRIESTIPPNVQFIGIDTAPARGAGERGQDGPPPLRARERVRIAGNLKPVSEQVKAANLRLREARHDASVSGQPHLRSWFCAEDYLQHLPDATFMLNAGAGQLRQFGRMGVFLTEQEAQKPLRNRIQVSLQTVANFRRDEQNIEIYIVSSVAGGTGAGMVIDVANIVRQEAANITGDPVTVRAFLFMARTFDSVEGVNLEAMQARAYATMREVNRFTSDFDPDYGYPLPYTAQEVETEQSLIKASLFDHVYYVDGYSDENSFRGSRPKYAHFPLVAEAIRSMIDGVTGDEYKQYTSNVRGSKAELKNTPVASSVGATAFVLPVKAWRSQFELRLAREAMDILVPMQDEVLRPFAYDNGSEGQIGFNAARNFLKEQLGASPTGSRASGHATRFPEHIAVVMDIYRPGQQNNIDEIEALGASTFRLAFGALQPGADAIANNVIQELPELRASAQVTVEWFHLANDDSAGPSKEGHWWPASQVERSRVIENDVQKFMSSQLGFQGNGGQYREALERWKLHHRNKFRDALGKKVDDLLSPSGGGNIIRARTARLGYVASFLGGLRTELELYEQAMSGVRARRNELGKTSGAEDKFQRARVDMQNASAMAHRFSQTQILAGALIIGLLTGIAVWAGFGASWVAPVISGFLVGGVTGIALAFFKGDAYYTQIEFVRATEALLSEQETDALAQVMSSTAGQMAGDVGGLLASVNAWAQAFRTSALSAYSILETEESALGVEKENSSQSLVRTYLWDEPFETIQYDRFTQLDPATGRKKKIEELLETIHWEPVRWAGGTGQLHTFHCGQNRVDAPPTSEQDTELLAQGRETATKGLRDALVDWASEVFRTFGESVNIVTFLMAHNRYRDAATFATALLQAGGDVKLEIIPGDLPQRLGCNFLRIPTARTSTREEAERSERWVQQVLEELAEITGKDVTHIIRGVSQDQHSCALVYTVDFIHLVNQVTGYGEAWRAYQSYVDRENNLGNNRRSLHCFPAEVNASVYEQLMNTELGQDPRALDNRVVRLLEHEDRLIQFLFARSLGIVASRDGDNEDMKLQFTLQRADGRGYIPLTLPTASWPDLFAAMLQFTCGKRSVLANQGNTVDNIDYSAVEQLINEELQRRIPGSGREQKIQRLQERKNALDLYLSGDGETRSEFDRDIKAIRRRPDGQPIELEKDRLTGDFNALVTMVIKGQVATLLEQVESVRAAS